MGELHIGPMHPQSGQTLCPSSTSKWYPPVAKQKERATADNRSSITRLTLGGWGSLALFDCQPR